MNLIDVSLDVAKMLFLIDSVRLCTKVITFT